jgi:IclR family KDG regulon transcriptional repressor
MTDGLIKTAGRVFQVFELFDRGRRPLRLKEVAEQLSSPVSSTASLLKTMAALGYLDYHRVDRTYLPTTRLGDLTAWVDEVYFADGQRLFQMLDELQRLTGETVSLATESDLMARYIYVAQCGQEQQLAAGSKRSLAHTGIGWLFLSNKTDRMIDNIVRRANIWGNVPKRIEIESVMEEVRKIRERNYVFAKNTLLQGSGIIAMLLPPNFYNRQFAVCVHGALDVIEPKEHQIVSAMRRLSQDVFKQQVIS